MPERPNSNGPSVGDLALRRAQSLRSWLALLALDVVFLRWIWLHFANWGFWDWDYQESLFEVSRVSLLEYGQIPLWNPYIGGGLSLAGNTLGHFWAPCFLPVLLFGTVAGTKLVIAAYLVLAQVGMWLLARARGIEGAPAFLAAILFSLGGVYAQRLTHGHFEWIAIAWMPFVLYHLHNASSELRVRSVCLGGLCFAFLFLDGGPYQFAFFSLFAGAYATCLAIEHRSPRPLLALPAIALLGAALAAIKLFPVLEVVSRFPRPTSAVNFYGAPFEPSATQILWQMFVSPMQSHDPELWMPFVLNVGAYVGWIPLVLVALGLARAPRRVGIWVALASIFLWVSLGPAAPIDLWHGLHTLPFFSSLRVPTRFNLYVLLMVALLAAEGLRELEELMKKRIDGPAARWGRHLALALVAIVGIELTFVNGAIFRVAFPIPPIETQRSSEFSHYARSPYLERYRDDVLYDVFPNWPGAAFPAIRENRGVLRSYRTVRAPNHALPTTSGRYRGEAFMTGAPRSAIRAFDWSPNVLRVETDGRPGKIIFNQNHDPGWRLTTKSGSVLAPYEGRLAVDVPEGMREIRLAYRPASFVSGAAVSGLTLIAGVALYLRSSGSRARRSP